MKLLQKSLMIGGLAIAMASCADESPWDTGYQGVSGEGSIKLRLTSSADVVAAVPRVRAAEDTDLAAPAPDEFSIKLSKEDGSFSKTWTSEKDFANEKSFPVGNYTMEVSYGSEEAQGLANDNSDYKNAYYYAKENVKVLEDQQTTVQLHATLANSVLKVEYTDAFKKYFKSWSTTLQSQGHPLVELGDSENICYITPGIVEVIVTAENQNGKSITLNPGNLEIDPKCYYRIRYNVFNGEVGEADKLEISFDDKIEQTHVITIDLTEDLFNAIPPVVTTAGFSDGQTIETQSGTVYPGDLQFNIKAMNDIAEARLTISSQTYKPSFLTNGTIDLCVATSDQQLALKEAGINVVGLFNNPEKLARIDFAALCANLPVGTHDISLLVKDKNGKTNEPVSMKISTLSVRMSVEPIEALLGQDYAELKITYDGPDPMVPGANPFSFQVRGVMNFEDCRIISINDQAYVTRAFDLKDYVYKIQLPEVDRQELPVKIFFNGGNEPCLETTITFKFEPYDVEIDAMATKIRLRVKDMDDAAKKERITRAMRVFVNDKEYTAEMSADKSFVTVSGLQPGQTYNVKTTTETKKTPDNFTDVISVITETSQAIPNGGFENLTPFLTNQSINQGGPWTDLTPSHWTAQQTKETYNVSEPSNGWATVNSKTCNLSVSKTANTWFQVPSTYSTEDAHGGSNGIVVRSVGYNYNGTIPGRSTHTNVHPYSDNEPSGGNAHSAAGKLFLGSYSASIASYALTGETYNQGISFGSRPTALTGWYKYTPAENDADDQGLVIVEIIGDNLSIKKVAYLSKADNWTKFTIKLDDADYAFFSKAKTLKVMIASSKNASENAAEEDAAVKVTAFTEYTQKYLGSTLTIDDLTFEY